MKLLNRISDSHYIAKIKYTKYIKTLPINENAIVLESQQGGQYNGNIYYIVRELLSNPVYSGYRVYVCVRKNKIEEAERFFKLRCAVSPCLVESFSDEYYRLIASAKYLVNDNTFLFFFIKRPEQVYLNTWHGTPLKTLGKKIANDMHNIGNAQRNLMSADLLLFQNEYMAEHMIEDYMLENVCNTHYLIEGSPRNSVLFDSKFREKVRSDFAFGDKQVVAYMPTWRGSLGNKSNPITKQNIEYILEELDARLDSNSFVVYVNLHPIESACIDFSVYRNIKQFPLQYETYEFLAAVDILVTDYSSVFFDFAVTRRKIILHAFDKDYYTSTRGMYLSLQDLPFPITETMDQLIKEINTPKQYQDQDFLRIFNPQDDNLACSRVVERFIFGKSSETIQERTVPDNGKDNVYIYVGKLASNGITSSLRNLLNVIDLNDKNVILLFHTGSIRKNVDVLRELSHKVNYLGIKGKMNLTLFEKVLMHFWMKGKLSTDFYMSRMHEAYQMELQRIFAGARVNSIIHFTGYGSKQLCLFSEFEGNTVVFVHANIRFEINEKHNLREDAAAYAYKHFKHVAAVSKGVIPPILDVSGGSGNIELCENAIDYKTVLEKSNEDIDCSAATVYPSVHSLMRVLNSNSPKFINVGRYSIEKGQIRLLDAFRQYLDSHSEAYLVIMGGEGPEYGHVISHAEKLGLLDKVVFILNMPNPFPVIKKCDYLVLTSFAESFGLVLAEADILGKPVFSTDIPGPRDFMLEHGGLLVEDSVSGIVDGIIKCVSGQVKPMSIDYSLYNSNVNMQFSSLLKNSSL